jgi:hypothetical protein
MHTTTFDATLVQLIFFSKKPQASAVLSFAYIASRLTFLAVIHGQKNSLFFGIICVQFLPPVHVLGQIVVVVSSIEWWVFATRNSASR